MTTATALITDSKKNFSLQTVQLPDPEDHEVLIRTSHSGVSIGTEFALIRGKLSWGPYPLVTGYMATGVVEAAGCDVDGVKVGDQVFARANRKITLADGSSASPVSGTHCSHIVTQVDGTHGVGVLPPNADLRTASMFTMPAVGYNGVDMAQPKLGESVVVHGCGLIGLGVVAASSLRGCRVIAVDVEERQLEVAVALGADHCINSKIQNLAKMLSELCPDGADVVFECTGIPVLIEQAIVLARVGGKFVWQGNYGEAPINFSFLIPHAKQLTTYFPCDDGYMPARTAVIKQMTSGVLPWAKTITHHVSANDSPQLYKRILDGEKSIIGATIDWS